MSPSGQSDQTAQSANQENSQNSTRSQLQIPSQILQQAGDAAAAARTNAVQRVRTLEVEPPIEDVPPPPYSASQYGEIDINEKGLDTGARVGGDGRVEIKISSKNRKLTSLLRHQLDLSQQEPQLPSPEPDIPAGLGYISGLPPPPMNIVIQIVGSRGDVQPFIALGQVLKNTFNHRVRIATHPVFKDFVTENGLEFFSIGGDPAELMAFMVKNPGLMPGFEAIRSGDIGKRRKGIYEMINGCWRSCIEPGDGTGVAVSDDALDEQSIDSGISMSDPEAKPFVADAIIANPPSFAHLHIAEKLGVPLHLMFTMPWSPTQSFPHPLANIVSSNADAGMSNFLSYILVDLLTWQGIGDVINRFREKTLRLEPLSIIWAPGNLHRLRIPWTYCWSPALIPKPGDWMTNIDISGFYFLNLATNYVPPPDLDEFLNAGPPPVYIGFGSIVIDDPNAMTKLIFEAVKKTGQRALVSKGWGGLSGDEMGVPDGVFMLGNCPHDWLFKKVSCVVHHGGAGTTAAGIAAGRPTIIVPFFGDQQFWGQMCHRAGAGPEPIPHKQLTSDNLAEAINFALKPDTLDRAKAMSDRIKQEKGSEAGAESFHRQLSLAKMRCSICPGRVAVWQYRKTGIRLSALAATVLANEGLLEFSELRLNRPKEYIPDTGPPEPISGGAAALIGTIGQFGAGVADYPAEILKSFKKGSHKDHDDDPGSPERRPSAATSPAGSSTSVATHSIAGALSTSPTRLSPAASSTNITVTDVDGNSQPKNGAPSLSSTSRTSSESASVGSSIHPERHPRASVISLEHGSRSRSSTPRGHERKDSRNRAQQITMDSVIGTAKATGNIVATGMKSPLDFTMSIAQGFHNAPKLYGDKTVRPTDRVTGFHSGIRAATKEFGYGFYDGISGLVTQPYQGAKEEGVVGFGKGLLKGSFGLILKPGAAVWALPGYTMKGIYAEIVKNFGKSTSNYIIAARTAQGYEDWKGSSEGERERIVAIWKSEAIQARTVTKRWCNKHQKVPEENDKRFYDENGQLLKGFRATKHLSYDDRKTLERLRKEGKDNLKSKSKSKSKTKEPAYDNDLTSPEAPSDLAGTTDAEFERAIRTAVQQTSNNDPEEDARIERAIRASIREFQRKMSATTGADDTDNEDEAYNRAIAASVAEYQRPPSHAAGLEDDVVVASLKSRNDDEQFSRALAASLEESRRTETRHSTLRHGIHSSPEDEDYRRAIEASKSTSRVHIGDTSDGEDDADYRRAIEESQRLHSTSLHPQHTTLPLNVPHEPPPTYEVGTEFSASPVSLHASPSNTKSSAQVTSTAKPDSDDEEFQRAIKTSEQEAKQREKERTEEDIVLEYVKRQSLAEEEYRRRTQK